MILAVKRVGFMLLVGFLVAACGGGGGGAGGGGAGTAGSVASPAAGESAAAPGGSSPSPTELASIGLRSALDVTASVDGGAAQPYHLEEYGGSLSGFAVGGGFLVQGITSPNLDTSLYVGINSVRETTGTFKSSPDRVAHVISSVAGTFYAQNGECSFAFTKIDRKSGINGSIDCQSVNTDQGHKLTVKGTFTATVS